MPMSDFIRGLRERVGTALLHIPSAAAAIFDAEDRILAMRHADSGLWTIPGGGIEPGESPAEAVVREAREETGLQVQVVRLLGAFGGPEFRFTYQNGDRVSFVSIVYECSVISGVLTPDGEESLEFRYVSEGETSTLQMSPAARTSLPSIFAAHRL